MVLKFGNDRNNYFSKNSRESTFWVHLKRTVSDIVVADLEPGLLHMCVICALHREQRTKTFPTL